MTGCARDARRSVWRWGRRGRALATWGGCRASVRLWARGARRVGAVAAGCAGGGFLRWQQLVFLGATLLRVVTGGIWGVGAMRRGGRHTCRVWSVVWYEASGSPRVTTVVLGALPRSARLARRTSRDGMGDGRVACRPCPMAMHLTRQSNAMGRRGRAGVMHGSYIHVGVLLMGVLGKVHDTHRALSRRAGGRAARMAARKGMRKTRTKSKSAAGQAVNRERNAWFQPNGGSRNARRSNATFNVQRRGRRSLTKDFFSLTCITHAKRL